MSERERGDIRRAENFGAHASAIRTPRIIMAGTAVLLAGALAFGGYALNEISNQTEQIQSERARNIRQACEAQNARHDATIETLDRLIARVPPSQRSEAQQSRASTVLLINALVPKRRCSEVVRKQVGL